MHRTPAHTSAPRAPVIDAFKAVARLTIVTHHLALYGPMPEAVRPCAPHLVAWLIDHGRMLVQVFLVVAGFLVAAALAPDGAAVLERPAALIPERYRRLAPPYLAALAVSVLVAMALRPWFVDDACLQP